MISIGLLTMEDVKSRLLTFVQLWKEMILKCLRKLLQFVGMKINK